MPNLSYSHYNLINLEQIQEHYSYKYMEKPEGYPEVVTQDQAMPSSSWLRGAKDDMSLSNLRLLALMEFFRELHFRRRELLRKIFPQAVQDELLELLKNSGMGLRRVKLGNDGTRFTTVQRSLSLGSPRSSGARDIVEPNELRNERFKVRTINAGGVGGDQNGGSASGASKGDGNMSSGTGSK